VTTAFAPAASSEQGARSSTGQGTPRPPVNLGPEMEGRGPLAQRILTGLAVAGTLGSAIMLAMAWSGPHGAGSCEVQSAPASTATDWLVAASTVSGGSFVLAVGLWRAWREDSWPLWVVVGICSAGVALAALALLAGVNVRGC
jgi:hypothetical protein